MKTIYTLLLLFPLLFFSWIARALPGGPKGHDITIKIKGFPKDSLARIGYYYGKNRYSAQDTAKADKNGVLHFKGNKELPTGVYICLMPKSYFEFLVTGESFTLETDTADLELNMKVKGSKENTVFYEFRKYTTVKGRIADSLQRILKKRKNADSVKMLRGKLNELDKEVDSFRKIFLAKHPGTYAVKLLQAVREPDIPPTPMMKDGLHKDSSFPYRYFKAHYFDNLHFEDEWLSRTPFFESKLEYYFKYMVHPAPDSIIKDADTVIEKSRASKEMFKYTLSWVLNHYEESEFMGMDAVTSHIIERYYLSGLADWVPATTIKNMRDRDSIVRNLLIGKVIPDAYLTDSNGKVITLYSVRHKYTLFYIWDATCGHCQKATPILHEVYQKYKGKLDMAVYAATNERKTSDWKKYIHEHKLGDWINVWDSLTVTDFRKRYDIYSTPVLYILDANKKIIAKRLDSSDMKQLEGFFDNLIKENENKKP